MVDAKDGGADGHAKGGGDPILAFAGAVRDFWLLGASAVESALAQGKAKDLSASVAPSVEQMLHAVDAFREMTAANINAVAGMRSSEDAGKSADMASLVTQAYSVAAMGAVRYWRRVAETYGAHQGAILRSLSTSTSDPSKAPEMQNALTDEVRAYLREIGDVSVQEARAFQCELEKLAADMANAAGATDSSSEYRRRWKAKP
jgi:hypothetical protein